MPCTEPDSSNIWQNQLCCAQNHAEQINQGSRGGLGFTGARSVLHELLELGSSWQAEWSPTDEHLFLQEPLNDEDPELDVSSSTVTD